MSRLILGLLYITLAAVAGTILWGAGFLLMLSFTIYMIVGIIYLISYFSTSI